MLNLKKIIKLSIIILIILIISIFIYIFYIKKEKILHGIDEVGEDIEYNLDKTIQPVKVRNDFYVVKTCVNKFYTYYNSIYDSENYNIDEETTMTKEDIQKESIEAVFNMLDSKYIDFKNLTKDNIKSNLPKINNAIININSMYISEQTNNISVYIVNGVLREKISGNISDFRIMVKLDLSKRTFSALLSSNPKFNWLKYSKKS